MTTTISQPLNIVRSRTYKLKIRLTGSDGQPYTLQTDDKLIFGIKKNFSDPNYACKKVVTSDAAIPEQDGVYAIQIDPADTSSMYPCSEYFYDVGLQRGAAYYSVIDASRLYLRGNVTSKED